MKSKRGFAAAVIMIALAVGMAGCVGAESDLEIEPEELAKALIDTVQFEDEMSQIGEGAFYALYGIDRDEAPVSYAVYVSTGATAEEVAVLKGSSREHAEDLMEDVKDRIDSQIYSFENYVPEELTKLENPVLKLEGPYVILCISNDNDKAEQVIREYLD